MPPPTDRAKVNGATSATGGAADGAVHIQKASFANHGEPGALRPLSCLAFEPGKGGPEARLLAGADDGTVLRIGKGRRVAAAWRAHYARVVALTYAGGGTFACASAGEDGYLKLWALIKVPADSGNVVGVGTERCVTHCQQLLGQWEMRGAGLGCLLHGPRPCLTSVPSRVGLAADFDLLLLSGYGVHQLSVHRPRRESEDAEKERWLFGSVFGEENEVEERRRRWQEHLQANGGGCRPLRLTNGWEAEAVPRCLLQGHTEPVRLLLAHPTRQRILTVDRSTARLFECEDSPSASPSASPVHSVASRPIVTVTLPVNEGGACCACFSASGGRWAIGLESGAALLIDEDPSSAEVDASYVGIDTQGVLRTLLELPRLHPSPSRAWVGGRGGGGAFVMPPSSSVVAMAFNREEDTLAIGTDAGVIAVHSLPRTREQQRRRALMLQIRSQVPQPVPYGVFGPELAPRKAGSCLLPTSAPRRISTLSFSVSSAHVFVFAPAGTVCAVAVRADGGVEPVSDDAVGGAEWPQQPLAEVAAGAASLCDGGALLAGRFHPVRRGQRLPLREQPNLAPPSDLASRGGDGSQLGQPKRKPRLSKRPLSLRERLEGAAVGAGVAAVGGQLGQLDVHSGLRWTTRAHEEEAHVVSHVAWTAGQRLAVTGDSHGDNCLCVWELRS